ncbi:MAG TPA: DUF6230 family protein [Ktedonobacteraceae bacterium]|jgi:hypothetical protein|nr:DUF6230 family protein [Ktedonobacteraceae bacterium]
MDENEIMQEEELQGAPLIGKTNRTIFWTVLLVALLATTFMLQGVENGAIAMAVSVPVPVTIQAKTLKGTNFHMFPGVSPADNRTPVGITRMDCTISGLTISKSFTLPLVGTFTFKLQAGQGSIPVTITGLTNDVTALSMDQGQFQNLTISTGPDPLDQTASNVTFTNATIQAPYQLISRITMPGLSISISHS